jgi:thiol peroxidase
LRCSVRKFNESAGKLENTAVLCFEDLPLLKTFCGAEGLEVINLSDFNSGF